MKTAKTAGLGIGIAVALAMLLFLLFPKFCKSPQVAAHRGRQPRARMPHL